MERTLRSEKGLTLVELLIAVALIGLVFALAFLLYAYGVGSFEQGTAQAAYQQKARLVHTLFKKELRNAGALALAPGGLEGEYDGFFYLENGSFYHNNTPVAEEIIDIQVKIEREADRSILKFMITSGAGAQNYILQDRFLLNNIAAPFDGSYDAYRSLNDLVLYYNPHIPQASPPQQHTLTVTVEGGGTSVPAPGLHRYAAGSLISLSAEADPGWVFEKWLVDTVQYNDPQIAVLMDRDRTATAYFLEEESGPSLAEILDAIDTLPFQNSPYDNQPIILVPEVEGVSFRFIAKTSPQHGSIEIIDNGQRVRISRHNNQTGSGTITLQAEKDGESMAKVFSVSIPPPGGAVTITAQ
ncbi:MAG: prepilin-type N-terminal cleavage/methylation domain-containing protein [Firmicutes bacterium]|nr:prepilin-type N-terminal cleavage/methylation domain-containing protein [Bacillota bacterium]